MFSCVSTSKRDLKDSGTLAEKGLRSTWFWRWEDALSGWCHGQSTSWASRRSTMQWYQDILMGPTPQHKNSLKPGAWEDNRSDPVVLFLVGHVFVLYVYCWKGCRCWVSGHRGGHTPSLILQMRRWSSRFCVRCRPFSIFVYSSFQSPLSSGCGFYEQSKGLISVLLGKD